MPDVPVIPESAPFTLEQRYWLNGFLAGLMGSSPGSPSAPEAAAPALTLTLAYGSQSGNAEGLAQVLGKRLGQNRIQAQVTGLEAFKEISWQREKLFLFICSTWGEGDMPDNAVAFWEWLKSPQAPSLAHARFAVLGLGDKNYLRFCQAGKNIDDRMAELGAQRLLPFQACEADFETTAEKWMTEISELLDKEIMPGSESVAPNGSPTPATTGEGPGVRATPATAAAKVEGKAAFDKKHPFPAPLLENHPLNAKGSSKDTRHIALSLAGSGLVYKPGDALGVWATNDYDLVDRVVLAMNCLGHERIALGEETFPLRYALLAKFDLRRASQALLEALHRNCRNASEGIRLHGLLSEPESEATRAFLGERDVLDALEAFPRTRLDPQTLIEILPRLGPRLYSIASSLKEHPDEVHLCVGVQRQLVRGRRRRGTASTFLAERVPLGVPVPVYVQPTSHFVLPESGDKPVIMVGPGTGVAPFRAFLQERRQSGHMGRNWLFFGDQRRATDFLYGEEFTAWQSDGFLTRLSLAFSRDQEEKVYVQHLMLTQAEELYAWLEEGAHFYVCGDAQRMAKDVDAALHEVIIRAGGKTMDQAKEYVGILKKEKRVGRDVY